MTIDTREELINALHVACEIEHSLLIQYLYAGFSMKRSLDEGLSAKQQQLLRAWQGSVYQIAREEMGHLGIACNLLSAIGSGPKMGRRSLPSDTGYFPFPFDLIPFGDESLYRFLVFELPRDFPLPPPQDRISAAKPLWQRLPLYQIHLSTNSLESSMRRLPSALKKYRKVSCLSALKVRNRIIIGQTPP
ncbi:hypothetical protein D1F64_14410 [Breoghania sp. L-A4]|nr:hypothetical protein D1F64_14410 [Breoghania sp. L-A4]